MDVSNLTDEKKGIIFRMLAEKPLYETGVAFGFDKKYATAVAVKNKVHRIYQEVQKDPNRYMVSPDLCETVVGIVTNRNPKNGGGREIAGMTHREVKEAKAADEQDITKLVLAGRAKAWTILHKKLDRVGRNKKALDELSLGTIGTIAGIMFDKGQIVQGQATENIAVMAKIDSNLTPEEAMKAVLNMREVNIIAKEKDKK